MQNAKPRLWYDNTQPKLVAAVNKLYRNAAYAARIERFDIWADRILAKQKVALSSLGLAILLTILTAFGPNVVFGTLGAGLSCVIAYRVYTYIVSRRLRSLPQAIRRGTYGFAAMWDVDAEWKKLADALTVLELNLQELMLTHPELVRGPITAYLTDRETVRARRAVRTGNSNDLDPHQAAITLSSKAREAAVEIERLLKLQ